MNIDKFLKYDLNNIPSILLNWVGSENVENSIKAKLMVDYAALYDESAAQKFMNKFHITGTDIEDYYTHLIDLGGDKAVISTINFRNIEGKYIPFIHILHKNFDFFTINEKDLDTIINRYKIFKPEFIGFYKHDLRENTIIQGYSVTGDSIVVAGHIDTIKQLPKPEKYYEISIEIIKNMDFYETYSIEYDDFLKGNLPVHNMVNKESAETMDALIKKNFVYKIIIDNEYAGIFAVNKTKEKYFNSYLIAEEILFKKFRGRGFAPAVQRKVIDNLNAGREELIFGTIHPQNSASLKTALKNERVFLGTNYLLLLKSKKL